MSDTPSDRDGPPGNDNSPSDHSPPSHQQVEAIRRKHRDDPDVMWLVDEFERANRVLTDVTAILDTTQMAWRGQEPDERSHEELRSRLDRLVTLLHSFHKGDEETERDAAMDAMEDIHREFDERSP